MKNLKTDNEKRVITGVVYEPNVPDSQGDFMEADTIEKIAYDFMENHQNIDIEHDFKANENIKIVESYITKSSGVIGNRIVKQGAWVMTVKVNDDEIWKNIKNGKLNAFSMGGTGTRQEIIEKKHRKPFEGCV